MIFVAGSSDRAFYQFGVDYESQVYVYRTLVVVAPMVAFVVTKLVCDELRRSRVSPLRGGPGTSVRRAPDGGFERADAPTRSRARAGG